MDENEDNTGDKRNWRERLGIGKTLVGAPLPKLGSEFNPPANSVVKTEVRTSGGPRAPAAKPVAGSSSANTSTTRNTAQPYPAARPAPMAPRPAAKAATVGAPVVARVASPQPARPAAIPGDALAAKLRDQRQAAEKLAIQRVAAAKQRAEATGRVASSAEKPKFTFADGDSAGASASPVPGNRLTSAPAPSPAPARTWQQPHPGQPQPAGQQMQPVRPQLGARPLPPNYTPQPTVQGFQPGYPQQPFANREPQYRPIDPSTGYPQQQGFNPGFNAQPRVPPAQPSQGFTPRPGLPPQGPAGSGSASFNARPRVATPPRGPQMPMAPALGRLQQDDIFEESPRLAQRRASANDYQQAYRDEIALEDEPKGGNKLGLILAFVLLAALAGFGAWGYTHFNGFKTTSSTGTVPTIDAPATPVKAVPDAASQGATDPNAKKQIYDRIEGDHEVPGGPLKATEQAPSLKQVGTPSPNNATPAPSPDGAGTDAMPLPLPPPPDANGQQQGLLQSDGKSDVASITPAAEQSSAANSTVPGDASSPVMTLPNTNSKLNANSGLTADTGQVKDAMPSPLVPEAASTTPKKPVDKMKNLVLGNSAAVSKSLGAKPVILVPPSKIALAQTRVSKPDPATSQTGDNSLYGGTVLVAPTVSTPPPRLATAAVKPNAATPATGAFVVQLSSFATKADATTEYQRLTAKHGAIISRYAPIIQQTQVAGSTRYRLNLGTMASSDVASSVCSTLITAGERDCSVQRQ